LKIRTGTLQELKRKGQKFACLTSYDNQTAQIFDEAGVAVLLVGDSASNAVLGNRDTVPITLEEMIPFGRAVANGAKNALVVFDLPFGSYEISSEQALEASFHALKQTGCAAVKLEGDKTAQIAALVAAGIPVMGHVGFTPQSIHALSGYKVQGRDSEGAARILQQCLEIEKAGAFSIVLEMVPQLLPQKSQLLYQYQPLALELEIVAMVKSWYGLTSQDLTPEAQAFRSST
jgi:Ketopantoate hydroxymethyltransferase